MVAPMNEEYTKKQQNRKLWNWCFSRCRCRETSETNMAAATRPEWMSGTLIHANLSACISQKCTFNLQKELHMDESYQGSISLIASKVKLHFALMFSVKVGI